MEYKIEYKVKWEGNENEIEVEAKTAENAYLKFLEDAHPEEKPVVVSYLNDLDGKRITESFSDHLDGATPSFNELSKTDRFLSRILRGGSKGAFWGCCLLWLISLILSFVLFVIVAFDFNWY